MYELVRKIKLPSLKHSFIIYKFAKLLNRDEFHSIKKEIKESESLLWLATESKIIFII